MERSSLPIEFINIIQQGDLEEIEKAMQRYNIDIINQLAPTLNQTALFFTPYIANDIDCLKVVKYLISLHVDPNFLDALGQTALYYAAREGKMTLCEYLIEECKIPVNHPDTNGQSPLFYAVSYGKLNTCRLLVDYGMNPYLVDKMEQNCLFYAVQNQRYEIIDYLLANGIDVNQIDKMKMNCLQIAYDLKDIRIVEMLLSKGAVLPYIPLTTKQKRRRQKHTSLQQGSFKADLSQEISLYTLVKIQTDGSKVPMTEEEIKLLKDSNPFIATLFDSKEELNKESKKQSDKLHTHEGLISNWEGQAISLMKDLWKVKHAKLFHHKIKLNKEDIPDYNQIIKHPMDFRTIIRKLNYNLYTNIKEFSNDVSLVFDNCFLYNGRLSLIGRKCSFVLKEYHHLMQLYHLDLAIS